MYKKLLYALGCYMLLQACGSPLPTPIAEAYEQLPEKIDYNFHVRPILSEHCFTCHGPDENKRKAGLRLDMADEAYKALESSGNRAIAPTDIRGSETYHRLISEEESLKMPPPESHTILSNQEKAILIKWIEQGAEYKNHWAFVKPKEPVIPQQMVPQQEIDAFVLEKLKESNLHLAPKATEETLIRRAAFDLTGLPPTLEQIDAFLSDTSSEAYEKVIDQLLAEATYGERMAAYWMEVARYADSDGYLDDKHRDFSPWRDWVIQAFNENMSYDEFVTLQLAGDLLPDAKKEQILPTAFNRLHKKNSEAGIDLEEFRVEYVADKAHTFGKAFLGLTLECARCHAHKYDPISQEDYYSIFAFFNQTDEIGHASYGPDITPGPSLLLTAEEVEAQMEYLEQRITEKEEEIEGKRKDFVEKNPSPKAPTIRDLQKSISKKRLAYYPFDELKTKGKTVHSPNKIEAQKPATVYEGILKPGKKGKALFNTDYSSAYLGEKVGWFERTDAFSIDFWIYPERIYDEVSVLLHCEDWRLGYKGYSLHLEQNQLKFLMAHAFPTNAIQLKTSESLAPKSWIHVCLTYDGSSKAEGVKIYLDGKKVELIIEADNLYKGILYEPNIHTYGFRGLQLGKRDGILPMDGGGVDELCVYQGVLAEREVAFLYANGLSNTQEQTQEWHISQLPEIQRLQKQLQETRAKLNDLLNEVPEIMVMKDREQFRPSFVLNRGVYDDHGKQVDPATPQAVLAFPPDLPQNRLGLARWLFHPENPLTARVMVNRIWEMHFGKGLVKTQEDFGNQGALPTHPELLDWLAIRFIESGWDIKALHKRIMLSETYQRSSIITKEALELDPENKLLARGARFRLPAEMIRDNALAISGLLVQEIGGPSAYPYQPEGLWDEISNKSWRYPYLQKPGPGLYRRSLYTIWKRTSPPPTMLIFDANDRSNCTVQRKVTSTPLQALVLLNDPQYLEAARVLAERLLGDGEGIDKMISEAFRWITGRLPESKEEEMLRELYEKEERTFAENPTQMEAYLSVGEKAMSPEVDKLKCAAMAATVHAIMNTDEAIVRK